MGKRRALVIAPHPDDEINLAGQFINCLQKKGYEIFVLYTTNGDAVPKVGNARLYEAIKACSILGIAEEYIIILGYPNEWKAEKHLYNSDADMERESKLGKKATNSIREHPEFCFQKAGIHTPFTREHFKRDFCNAILEIKPDLIICPEFDSHPDHRATSLFFDEIMGEILSKQRDYTPTVLKKYIHEGVWNGPKDYYFRPAMATQTKGVRPYCGSVHDLDSPCFCWDDRISYKSDDRSITELLKDNIVFHAAKAHKSTTAWYEMQRVLNADIVYWLRPTNNFSLHAKFAVTSGNPRFLNDFKLYDCDDVCKKEDPFSKPELFCWRPNAEDAEKTIRIEFSEEKEIKRIRIYEDCNIQNHIKRFQISIGQRVLFEGETVADGSKTEIAFQEVTRTDHLSIKILEWSGIPGIAEIEVLPEHADEIPFQMEKYEAIQEQNSSRNSIFQKIEKFILLTKFLFVFKAKYEIQKMIKNRWGDIQKL